MRSMMMTANNTPIRSDARAAPPFALRCTGLVKRYPDVTAVDGIDLEVYTGECFGLLGPNGAGKTTTVEIFEGLTKPDEGKVEVLGSQWNQGQDHALRNRFGVQLQETQLTEKLTVRETVQLFSSFYSEKRDARVGKLSGGQKQRLALACALAGDPELLFLDEPTTGLDPQARLKLWDIVEEFRAGGGSIVLTTHYMEEAARLCDRVGVMDHGRVIALDTPAKLIESLGADQILEFSIRGEINEGGLKNLAGVRGMRASNSGYALTVSDIGLALPALLAEIDRQRVELVTLTTHQATLEDVFVSLTGRMLRDGRS
jgi:ABC-2 type transport system ATP-binding protein